MFPDSCFHNRIDDRREKLLVVKHLVRRPDLLRSGVTAVQKTQYLRADPDLQILLNVLESYFDEFGTLPSVEVLLMEIDAYNHLSLKPFPDKYMGNYRAALAAWYVCTDWADDYVKVIIQEEWSAYIMHNMSVNVADNDDILEVQKHLNKAHNEINHNLFGGLVEETAWVDIEGNLKQTHKERLGIKFIDQVLDGGLAQKEALLFIAPSGGGKTTLGMQMAAEQVRKGVHILYWATEQPLQGDMAIRQYVLGGGLRRSDFKDGYSGLTPEKLHKIEMAKAQWLEYFHFIDCRKSTQKINSIEDLFVPLDKLISESKAPVLVILDWWGRLRSRMIMNQDRLSDTRMRHASAEWMDSLLDGVKERDSRTVVLHQTSGKAAQKGPDATLTTHDAQEDTNLNNLFEFGFAMSKLNSDNMAKINCDKARSSARTDGHLQLHGDECKFGTVNPGEIDIADLANHQQQQADDHIGIDAYLRGGAE